MDTILAGQIGVVTGANRGIGFEVCRQLAEHGMTVILGARDLAKAEAAAKTLLGEGLDVRAQRLDVTDAQTIESVHRYAADTFGKLDVLINNAGINYDIQQHTASADIKMVQETLETNLFGAWRMSLAFLDLLRASEHGRIVNVSSEAGAFGALPGSPFSLSGTGGLLPAYCVSKTALNAFTVKLATDLKETGVLVNAICPGWTATYPGAEAQGARPVAEGAASIVWGALLPKAGPTAGFFRDGQPLPW